MWLDLHVSLPIGLEVFIHSSRRWRLFDGDHKLLSPPDIGKVDGPIKLDHCQIIFDITQGEFNY